MVLGAGPGAAETAAVSLDDDMPISLSGSYLAARSADAQHDIEGALTYFDRAADADPGNPILLERVVVLRLANGDINRAMEEAKQLVLADDANPLGRLANAVEAIKKGDFFGAQTELAAGAKSPLGTLTNGLITAWLKQGLNQVDEAFTTIDGLSGPNWYEIFKDYHRALIADLSGRADLAADSIARARNSDGAAMRVLDAYARIFARKGDRGEAIKALKSIGDASPGHPLMKALLAELNSDRPITPLARSTEEGVAEVLYGLGSAIGLDDGAELPAAYLQLARYLDPNDDLVTVALGDIFQGSGSYQKAVTVYTTVPDGSPLKRTAEIQTGACLDAIDKPDEAAAHMRKVVAADPSDLDAVIALGNLFRGRDRFSEAAEAYSLGIVTIKEPSKDDWRIYYYRGVSLERSKRWPEAEADFRLALKIDPNQPQVLNYLGYSWVDQGVNLDQALDMIKTAVDLRPDDGYIVDSLGWAYYRLGRYEEAVTQLERAVDLKSSDPVLNDHLGDAYWKVGRKLEARFQWNHARDLKPEKDELPKILKKIEQGLVEDDTRQLVENRTTAALVKTDAAPQTVALGNAKENTEAASSSLTVRAGDSLWTIAAKVYGKADLFSRIFDANRGLITDPDRIFPGMTLTIPAKDGL
jgi:tetratricopeptide (TPR) repeat protein